MNLFVAFIAQHWRMSMALVLAGGLYVQHLQLNTADAQRAAAIAQSALWQSKVDAQNDSIQSLKQVSDARDAKAQKAVSSALANQAADRRTIQALLAAQPKPGQDRCVAARELIWNTINPGANP